MESQQRIWEILQVHGICLEKDVEPMLRDRINSGEFNASPDLVLSVVRLCVMNQQMKKQGLEPLLFDTSSSSLVPIALASKHTTAEDKREELRAELDKWVASEMKEEDVEVGRKYGLEPREYVTVFGDHGKFLDLKLEKRTYTYLTHRTKCSLIMSKFEDRDAVVQYLIRKIVLFAKRRCRRPEIIPRLQNIYAETILFIRSLRNEKCS